jgi:enterochelin esterase-like enzyme
MIERTSATPATAPAQPPPPPVLATTVPRSDALVRLPVPRDVLRTIARGVWTPAAWTAALALAALAVLQVSVGASITAFWVYLNFDPDRGGLLSTLVVALAAAGVGALPWRRRGVAVAATVAGYSLTGARLLLAQVNAPPLPGVPALPPLSGWGLVRALVVVYSLAAVCAAFGAGLGAELGDWVAVPSWRVLHEIVARLIPTRAAASGGTGWRGGAMGAALVLVLVALCLSSVGSASDLLFYGSQSLVQVNQPPVETSPATAQHGQSLQVTYTSALFGGQRRHFDVYLPPDYAASASANARYAVLYLLHGSPGNPDDMLQALLPTRSLDLLITSGQIRPIIVVAPDGRSGAPVPTQWMDSTLGHFPVESAFLHEVIPYVDTHFRTFASPAGRVVGGLSMGGYGAANLAVKHPDIFGGVIAMGAYFAPEGFAQAVKTSWYTANSPSVQVRLATSALTVTFYLAAAKQDKPYVDETEAFAQELGALGANYVLQTWSGGHAWTIWEAQIVTGVRWFFGITTHRSCVTCRIPSSQ